MNDREKIERLDSYLMGFRPVQEAVKRALLVFLATGDTTPEYEEDIRNFMDSEFPIPDDAP